MKEIYGFIASWSQKHPRLTTLIILILILSVLRMSNNPLLLELIGGNTINAELQDTRARLDKIESLTKHLPKYFILGRVSDRENVLNDYVRLTSGTNPDNEQIERALLICDVTLGGGWTNKMRKACMALQEYADEKGYSYDSILLRAQDSIGIKL